MARLNQQGELNTAKFLDLFGDKHQFFTLPSDGKDGFYGTYERNKTGLRKHNMAGKDIYYTVNEARPGTSRTKDKYVRTRAIWIDDDGPNKNGGVVDPSKFPIPPNLVVNTSPGKYHYYWLTETTDAETTEAVLRGMAKDYHGDPSVTDRLRVLRLPGFVHNKSGQPVAWSFNHDKVYSWEEILEAFPPLSITSNDWEPGENKSFSVKQAIDDILSGNNVHESRRGLAMHWANSGMPKQDALATLNGYVEDAMRSGMVEKGRAYERLANMKQAVESAYAKLELETPPKFKADTHEEYDKYTRFSKAPGALGRITDSIMDYMPYPSYEMALTVAQHCVSTFGGGLYHIKKRPCNRKRTLLASTGRGKSIADKYYNELVRRMALRSDLVNPYIFNGNNSYAVNNMHMELIDHRVRSYIMSEAGLMGKSTAGTTSETRAYILNIISASIKSAINAKLLSVRTSENRKMNDALKTVYGGVAVFLSESVPGQYVDVLNSSEAFLSGDVAREELVFVDPQKPAMNFEAEGEIPEEIVEMMAFLAKQFEESGYTTGDEPSNPDQFAEVNTDDVEKLFSKMCEDNLKEENIKSREGDTIAAAMLSRIPEKVLVTCMVCAIADAASTRTQARVTKTHFQFAVEYHKELIRSLEAQRVGGSLADPLTLCSNRLIEHCQSYGVREMDRNYSIDYTKKIISRQWITKVLDRSKFKPIDMLIRQRHNNRELAMREVIQHCEDINLITRVPTQGKVLHWRINT